MILAPPGFAWCGASGCPAILPATMEKPMTEKTKLPMQLVGKPLQLAMDYLNHHDAVIRAIDAKQEHALRVISDFEVAIKADMEALDRVKTEFFDALRAEIPDLPKSLNINPTHKDIGVVILLDGKPSKQRLDSALKLGEALGIPREAIERLLS